MECLFIYQDISLGIYIYIYLSCTKSCERCKRPRDKDLHDRILSLVNDYTSQQDRNRLLYATSFLSHDSYISSGRDSISTNNMENVLS